MVSLWFTIWAVEHWMSQLRSFALGPTNFGPRGHSFMSTQLWEPLKQIDPEIVHGFEKMHHRNDAPSLDLDENAVNAITENPSVIGKQRAGIQRDEWPALCPVSHARNVWNRCKGQGSKENLKSSD
jgi:hypothetical protein